MAEASFSQMGVYEMENRFTFHRLCCLTSCFFEQALKHILDTHILDAHILDAHILDAHISNPGLRPGAEA